VWDGDLVTAGGVTSGIDLGLEIVERLSGVDARKLVEQGLEIETPA
jgi:transcriptional regulator GlxA family with amidase domain